METTIAGLTAFPATKSGIKKFADEFLNSVLDGYQNPLQVKVQLSALKKLIEEIEKSEEFKESVMNEAAKYQKAELSDLYNANIQIKETRVEYDYLACGHPEYNRINEELERQTAKKKALEKYLQLLSEPTEYIDPVTAESVTLIPAPKTSTTSISITINK